MPQTAVKSLAPAPLRDKDRALDYCSCAEGTFLIGAGTVINPIVKVVTTVAILGAVYLFFVKPALDTGKEITASVGEQTRRAVDEAQARTDAIQLDIATNRAESYGNSLRSTWPEASRVVRGCVKEAHSDADAMDRCVNLGQTIVTQVQSNRNFARSYADSLAASGRTAEADEVLRCVEDAGFKVGPMQRCRNLADRFLFG